MLRIVQAQPPIVSGAHFRHAERVKVTFDLGAQRFVRIVRTTAAGSFSASAASGISIGAATSCSSSQSAGSAIARA